jgi:hypothetical protein
MAMVQVSTSVIDEESYGGITDEKKLLVVGSNAVSNGRLVLGSRRDVP